MDTKTRGFQVDQQIVDEDQIKQRGGKDSPLANTLTDRECTADVELLNQLLSTVHMKLA